MSFNARLVSENLLDNSEFMLNNGTNPVNWYSENGVSCNNETWVLEDTTTLQSSESSLYMPNRLADTLDYVRVAKSAQVAGVGKYANYKHTEYDLESSFVPVKDYAEDDSSPLLMDRYFTQNNTGDKLQIKNLETTIEIDVKLLRNTDYSDPYKKKTYVIQEKNGKRTQETLEYNHVKNTLEFQDCIRKMEALQSFVNTCQYYGVGFYISLEVTPETADYDWGGFSWGTGSAWGGSDTAEPYWTSYYKINPENVNLERFSTMGIVSINALIEQSEVSFVSY